MEYRKAHAADLEHILALQKRNLLSSLPTQEQKDGFLSTAYTREQFQGMQESLFIVVCWDNNRLCGYLCASKPEFIRSLPNPFPQAMIQHCGDAVLYQGKPLNEYRFFIGNPACVDKAYRGQGVLLGLAQYAINTCTPMYDLGITFISTDNHRSLKATQKIGLKTISQFAIHGNTFWILAYPLRENIATAS